MSIGLQDIPRAIQRMLVALVRSFIPGTANEYRLRHSSPFVPWEMPYFGSSWSKATFPIPMWNNGATHLFGTLGLSPTLTREIEGKVVKEYRQWQMLIYGLNPADRLLTPMIPPLPLWYTGVIQNKYGYNLGMLQSFDAVNNCVYDKVQEYHPAEPGNSVPNLYSATQYSRKASLYFDTWQEFRDDLEKRLVRLETGQWVLPLNGITYIAGDLGTPGDYFAPRSPANNEGAREPITEFWVAGRGMFVCSGNAFLNCSIRMLEESQATGSTPLFSLIARNGGVIFRNTTDGGQRFYRLDGSVYSDLGIMVPAGSSLRIFGNWVTNRFNRATLRGTTEVNYLSSRVRSSFNSLHPERGRFDPTRYYGSLSPAWVGWQEK
jgi:hypothetical protein